MTKLRADALQCEPYPCHTGGIDRLNLWRWGDSNPRPLTCEVKRPYFCRPACLENTDSIRVLKKQNAASVFREGILGAKLGAKL
jgi:hypothetical protein